MTEWVATIGVFATAIIFAMTGYEPAAQPAPSMDVQPAGETVLIRGCEGLSRDHLSTLREVAAQKGEPFDTFCQKVVREAAPY